MKKRVWIIISLILVFVLLLSLLQMLLIPKYASNREGALIREYYDERGDHDVIFVGDCEIYESLVPAVLWEEYGISSYLRGSPQQLIWHSYYLLEETLRYEDPSAVVFNVLSMKYGEPQSEAYNRMTLDDMRWSSSKLSAIRASMTEEEHFVEYVFPLLRYHSRITELTGEDFRYWFKPAPKVSHSGYLMQTGILPQTDFSAGRPLRETELPDLSWDYLDRMRALCEEKGIEFILMKAPTNHWAYWWYDEWNGQVEEYAQRYGLAYYNFIPLCEEIGIDWSEDTYDRGAHLNVYGAEKLTRYFGSILKEEHGIADRRSNETLELAWRPRVKAYYEEKHRMEQEGK